MIGESDDDAHERFMEIQHRFYLIDVPTYVQSTWSSESMPLCEEPPQSCDSSTTSDNPILTTDIPNQPRATPIDNETITIARPAAAPPQSAMHASSPPNHVLIPVTNLPRQPQPLPPTVQPSTPPPMTPTPPDALAKPILTNQPTHSPPTPPPSSLQPQPAVSAAVPQPKSVSSSTKIEQVTGTNSSELFFTYQPSWTKITLPDTSEPSPSSLTSIQTESSLSTTQSMVEPTYLTREIHTLVVRVNEKSAKLELESIKSKLLDPNPDYPQPLTCYSNITNVPIGVALVDSRDICRHYFKNFRCVDSDIHENLPPPKGSLWMRIRPPWPPPWSPIINRVSIELVEWAVCFSEFRGEFAILKIRGMLGLFAIRGSIEIMVLIGSKLRDLKIEHRFGLPIIEGGLIRAPPKPPWFEFTRLTFFSTALRTRRFFRGRY